MLNNIKNNEFWEDKIDLQKSYLIINLLTDGIINNAINSEDLKEEKFGIDEELAYVERINWKNCVEVCKYKLKDENN